MWVSRCGSVVVKREVWLMLDARQTDFFAAVERRTEREREEKERRSGDAAAMQASG